MGYAIICNARKGRNKGNKGIKFLALVDRDKSKNLWWVSDNPSLIIDFYKEETAIKTCKRLKLNKPRVVPYQHAVSIISRQGENLWEAEKESMHEAAMYSVEEGWDGHKDSDSA